MLDLILSTYARNQGLLQLLTDDVPDEAFADQPHPGMNHPAWIVGHLAWASDLGCKLLGRRAELIAWSADYGTGSSPRPDRASYAPKAELLAAYDAAHARFAEALPGATQAVLSTPLPDPRMRTIMPTIGDALVHLATLQEGLHLGQLSAWRRVRGAPPVPLF